MKAEELRIGNYVHIDAPISESNKLIRVSAYHLIGLLNKTYKYNPIPLTEEWLLKFGFVNWYARGYFELAGFKIDFNNIVLNFELNLQLKYVHQLQNLYFVLTNNELEIK